MILASVTKGVDAYACETEASRHQAPQQLYKNEDFRRFTCGVRACNAESMADYVEFDVLHVPGEPDMICVVQTSASVKGRYIGVLTRDEHGVKLQLVVFGRYLKAVATNDHRAELRVYDVTDDEGQAGSWTSYQWTGTRFEETDDAKTSTRA